MLIDFDDDELFGLGTMPGFFIWAGLSNFSAPPPADAIGIAWTMPTRILDYQMEQRILDYTVPIRQADWSMPNRNEDS